MAKPKSTKLRTLITLQALMKYSDANHRMNSVKLNEHLRPYGLECTGRVLNDTVRVLREMGFDVRNKGEWGNQGIWIEDRPLPEYELRRLIFAVTTNPHLSKEQATEILRALHPFVTVYQEPLLQGLVEKEPVIDADDSLYGTYSLIQEAITSGRRVRYINDYIKHTGGRQGTIHHQEHRTMFTPKCIYQARAELYMVGYNNTEKRADVVNLNNIAAIKLAFKHRDPKESFINQWIEDIVPTDVVPGEKRSVVYEGPAFFQCQRQYFADLCNRFGPPSEATIKFAKICTFYPVHQAQISSEDLHWLSQVPDMGIRIVGPDELTAAINEYYSNITNALVQPLETNKKQHSQAKYPGIPG